MLLGSAGTGKTSLKRSLMEEPFNPNTTSTIVSDVSSVRPFGHEWETMRGNKWREATKEDEIEELAHLFNSIHFRSSSHHAPESSLYHSLDLGDTSAKVSDLATKSCIEKLLIEAHGHKTTDSLFQVSHTYTVPYFILINFSHFFIYGIVVVSQCSLRFSQPSSLLVQCFSSCLMLQRILEKDGSHVLLVNCIFVK